MPPPSRSGLVVFVGSVLSVAELQSESAIFNHTRRGLKPKIGKTNFFLSPAGKRLTAFQVTEKREIFESNAQVHPIVEGHRFLPLGKNRKYEIRTPKRVRDRYRNMKSTKGSLGDKHK